MKHSILRNSSILRAVLPWLLLAMGGYLSFSQDDETRDDPRNPIHYLEIVTPEVNATCTTYAQVHGVEFSGPQPELGNARTAELPGGGILGVRAPLRDDEQPVVRAYMLVDDIEAAVKTVEDSGGEIAHPPMELPGRGKFAIYIQGDIQHALWQN